MVGNLEIADEVTLTIAAGTKVEFEGFYSISVQGCLLVLGDPQQPILFTSKNPQIFSIDHTTSGAWAGIEFRNTSALNEKSVFRNCIFEYSKSILGLKKGGAISIYNVSKLEIINSIFRNNVAEYGSAISFEYQSAPQIFGNLFYDNYAFVGGSPIYCSYSYPNLTNNTMVNNVVLNEDSFYKTGAIQTFISKSKVTNNIVWGNVSAYYDSLQLIWCKGYYTNYNNIEFGYEGCGNIDTDPLFVGASSHPFSLQANSACINSGIDDTTGLFIYPEDLRGNSRIFGDIIDMGAYEWVGYEISEPENPAEIIQLSNYPNPFSAETTIRFSLKYSSQFVNLAIYNLRGQLVETLLNETKHAGDYSVNWKPEKISAGIYFYKINVGDETVGKKMILMRK